MVEVEVIEMGKMGVLGLVVLVVLLASPGSSDAIWSGKKEPATAGEAAKEYAKEAVRNTADAAANVGELFGLLGWEFVLEFYVD